MHAYKHTHIYYSYTHIHNMYNNVYVTFLKGCNGNQTMLDKNVLKLFIV